MNQRNNVLVALSAVSILALGGCSSTSNTKKQPEIDVKNTAPIEWNSDESVALNIVKMGYRDGVGKGVSDMPQGEKNEVTHDDPNALLSFASGFYQGGFLPAFGALLWDDKIESLTKWYPFMIDFIHKDKLNVDDQVLAVSQVSSHINESLQKAFASIENAEYHGFFNTTAGFEYRALFSGEYCKKAFFFLSDKKGEISNQRWKKFTVGVPADLRERDDVCDLSFVPKVVGTIDEYYVLIYRTQSQAQDIYFMLNSYANYYRVLPNIVKGYSIPDEKFMSLNIGEVAVLKDNKRYVFDEDEVSTFDAAR